MLSILRQSLKATAPVAGYLTNSRVSSALFHPIGFRLMSSSFEKPSHPEFHRHSTRYCDSNRQILDILDKGWEKQPHLEPQSTSDHVAYKIVRFLRVLSDMYFKRRLIARACF